jgi:mono/diheme cytochrome c family protein
MRLVHIGVLAAAVTLAIAACGGTATTTTIDPADLVPGDVAHGADIYKSTCAACHGGDANGINGLGMPLVGSALVVDLSEDELAAFIKVGRTRGDPDNTTGIEMPPKGGNSKLNAQDLLDVAAYLQSLNS